MSLTFHLLINVLFFVPSFATSPSPHRALSAENIHCHIDATVPLTLQVLKISSKAIDSTKSEEFKIISEPRTSDLSVISPENNIIIQAIAHKEVHTAFSNKCFSWVYYSPAKKKALRGRCLPASAITDKKFVSYMQIFTPLFITNCFNRCLEEEIEATSESLALFCTHAVLKELTELGASLEEGD